MRRVQSIERAFRLLDELADEPGGITNLARRIDLPTSTVARLLRTLEHLGAIERTPDDHGYRIGPTVVTLSTSVDPTQSLLAVAQPHMVELVDLLAEASRSPPGTTSTTWNSSTAPTRSRYVTGPV